MTKEELLAGMKSNAGTLIQSDCTGCFYFNNEGVTRAAKALLNRGLIRIGAQHNDTVEYYPTSDKDGHEIEGEE